MEDIIASVAGIDTSKDELVLNVDGIRRGGFANNRDGLAKMRQFLPCGTQIHIEASGGCDRLPRQVLQDWGFAVHLHNPRKVRRAADARGFIAKNDAMDAHALVEVGPFVRSRPAKSAVQEALCDISRTIKNLRDQATLTKVRMKTPLLPAACVKSYLATIKAAERQITVLEKAYLKLLKTTGSSIVTNWLTAFQESALPHQGLFLASCLQTSIHSLPSRSAAMPEWLRWMTLPENAMGPSTSRRAMSI